MASILCFTGMLLFVLGLLNGVAIPKMRSSRLGLSAHLTGVQSGTFLIAVGLLWSKLVIVEPWNAILGHAMWISLFSLWLSLALAGAFGAGRGLPIAGQGITTTSGRQALVSVLLIGGSLVILASTTALLIMWRWAP